MVKNDLSGKIITPIVPMCISELIKRLFLSSYFKIFKQVYIRNVFIIQECFQYLCCL